MKNFDLIVYGNTILDRVYFVDGYMNGTSNAGHGQYSAAGSVGNMLRAFCELGGNKKIKVVGKIGDDEDGEILEGQMLNMISNHPNKTYFLEKSSGPTSSAVIISDIRKNSRTSIVNWGACKDLNNIDIARDSAWVHLMYIDTLEEINPKDIESLSEGSIVSADLCLGSHTPEQKEKIFKCLEFIDYLIVSDVEAQSLTTEIKNGVWRSYCAEESAKILGKIVKKGVIVHSPHGSTTFTNGEKQTFSGEYIGDKSLNVLGAGDIFASSFIDSMLGTDDISESVKFAHHHTTSVLKSRGKNEKV